MMYTPELHIALCDDSADDLHLLHTMLTEYLLEHRYEADVRCFASGEDLLASEVSSFDLVFLDIFMAGLNGMDTARQLHRESPHTKIVFCSSSPAFGVESYEVHALRYILKPLQVSVVYPLLDTYFRTYTALSTVSVKIGRNTEQIYLRDIVWVEASNHKTIVHTEQEDLVCSMTFSAVCSLLPPEDFVKPIRYAYVSLRHVLRYPSDTLTLSGGVTIPVSRNHREEVRLHYTDFRWNLMND